MIVFSSNTHAKRNFMRVSFTSCSQLRGADRRQGDGAGWMSAHLCEEVHAAAVLPTALGTAVSL